MSMAYKLITFISVFIHSLPQQCWAIFAICLCIVVMVVISTYRNSSHISNNARGNKYHIFISSRNISWETYSWRDRFFLSNGEYKMRLVPANKRRLTHVTSSLSGWDHTHLTQCDIFNSSTPGAAHMRRWTGSALAQVVACHLFGAKPLPEPILTNGQLDNLAQTSVTFESKHFGIETFSFTRIRKRRLRNGGGYELRWFQGATDHHSRRTRRQ